MLSVPAQMQPTLDQWKKNLNLGEGMKFGATSRPESYQQLMDQVVGALIIVGFGFVAYAFFKIQDKIVKGGIRSEEAHEIAGLDMPEMGVLAYPDFVGTHASYEWEAQTGSATVMEEKDHPDLPTPT